MCPFSTRALANQGPYSRHPLRRRSVPMPVERQIHLLGSVGPVDRSVAINGDHPGRAGTEGSVSNGYPTAVAAHAAMMVTQARVIIARRGIPRVHVVRSDTVRAHPSCRMWGESSQYAPSKWACGRGNDSSLMKASTPHACGAKRHHRRPTRKHHRNGRIFLKIGVSLRCIRAVPASPIPACPTGGSSPH